MICHDFDLDGAPMFPRKVLVGNTNHEETLFRHDVFAIVQLQDELPRCYFLTESIPLDACFLEQFAARRILKALACLQGAARRGPIVVADQWPALERESKQQQPIVS